MNKDRIKGAAQKGVGAIKEVVGKVVGSEKLEAEGAADKVAGTVKEAYGKSRDATEKAAEEARESIEKARK